ncbi:MAG: small multi-drug export protein, partial [Acutalibacter sp.]|nr:small multi-drug export protein [Acutalibacter sp.]
MAIQMEHIVTSLVNFFSQTIPGELTVFLLSLMPVIELRGGILAAKLLHLEMLPAFFICFVGTILPT